MNAIDSFNQGLVKAIDINYPDITEQEAKRLYKVKNVTAKQLTLSRGGKDYLINKRKLSTRLVNGLIDRDLLRELKYGDALFVWKEKGQEVGSDIQGTRIDHEKYGDRGTKKMVVPGSKKNYGFNFSVRTKADKQKFFIFESPIDALSFYQTYMPQNYQKKDEGYRFISLNGAGTKLETIGEFFKTVGVPDELHLNFDTEAYLAL